MAYRRLPFAQYFINTSEDFNATRRSTVRVNYTAISYTSGALDKLLGLQREVNYEIHYEPERDVIQINFQRTIGFADWLVNFEFAAPSRMRCAKNGASCMRRIPPPRRRWWAGPWAPDRRSCAART